MHSNVLPANGGRKKFLMLTFALPMLLMYLMVILGVLADFIGAREITFQSVHSVAEEEAEFELLKARIEALDDDDSRVREITMDDYDQAVEGCEGRLITMSIMFHAKVMDAGIQEPREALVREAFAAGLGPQCGGFYQIKMESTGSADGRAWLMPVFVTPLAALILLFNGLSRRGWRPLWLNWADWQPSVGRVVALRLCAGYGALVLLVVIALGALADLAGWLPEKSPSLLPALEQWPWLIVASLIAPIFEEFIYRAWLLERLTRVIRESTALLLSTASFAAIHLPSSIFEWFNFFLVGLVLGLLWLRTRSLLAVVLAHGLYNGVLLILQILLSS